MTSSFLMLPSPLGSLKLVATDLGLAAVLWENDNPRRVRLGPLVQDPTHPILREAARQLDEYFCGQRRAFSLPLDASGTAFQKSVWQALASIPYGETRSYAELALQIGRPSAARAVGAANARNPLSLIVPCHRVIGTGGHLTGFAGGLQTKAWLLEMESSIVAASG